MPKVMHINCSSVGSTGKIIHDIADHTISKGYTHLLCVPRTKGNSKNVHYFATSLPYEQGIYRRLNNLYGFQYGFAPISTMKILNHIKREKPDIIHLHCTNGYMVDLYILLSYIKKYRIPVVFTNHAEFYYTGSCPHAFDCDKWLTGCGNCQQKSVAGGSKLLDTSRQAWNRMKHAMMGLEKAVMISVSPWVGERAQQSPLTRHLPQEVVLNGVNTDVFTYMDKEVLRKKYKLPQNGRILLHPTAHFSAGKDDPKGGYYIIEMAKCLKDQNATILVAGDFAPGLKLPENLVLLGHIADQLQLAEYYALADVTVIASRRETFGMPVAESLCCGTPVASFMAGGPHSIALPEYCAFAPDADLDGLLAATEMLLQKRQDPKEISAVAQKTYAAAVMAEGYKNIYEKLLVDGSI